MEPLFFFFLLLFVSLAAAQAPDFLNSLCIESSGKYTANSTYKTNLDTVLSNITTLSSNGSGFYNFSAGNSPDRVNSVSLCRGDVTPDDCLTCLENSAEKLTERCPNQKEAVVWYDNCMLRYSNRSIAGVRDSRNEFYTCNPKSVSVSYVDEFDEALSGLLDRLVAAAASGGSAIKFATGSASPSAFQTIYAMAQCSPDLSTLDCRTCLVAAIAQIPTYCNHKTGGRYANPSCNLRFESYPFFQATSYDLSPTAPPPRVFPSSNSTERNDRESRSVSAADIVVPVVAAVAIIIGVGTCLLLRFRKPKEKPMNLAGMQLQVWSHCNSTLEPLESQPTASLMQISSDKAVLVPYTRLYLYLLEDQLN